MIAGQPVANRPPTDTTAGGQFLYRNLMFMHDRGDFVTGLLNIENAIFMIHGFSSFLLKFQKKGRRTTNRIIMPVLIIAISIANNSRSQD
jgi:hypothetical protein